VPETISNEFLEYANQHDVEENGKCAKLPQLISSTKDTLHQFSRDSREPLGSNKLVFRDRHHTKFQAITYTIPVPLHQQQKSGNIKAVSLIQPVSTCVQKLLNIHEASL
jgi:hypothetical protein